MFDVVRAVSACSPSEDSSPIAASPPPLVFSSFAQISRGGSGPLLRRDALDEKNAAAELGRVTATHSEPGCAVVSLPVVCGDGVLQADHSVRTGLSLSSHCVSAFSWIATTTSASDALALDGVGLADLPADCDDNTARFVHALQYFEYRCTAGGDERRKLAEVTEAISSLRALCSLGRIPCFHVLCGAVSVLFRRSSALVHPSSALRNFFDDKPSMSSRTVASIDSATQPDVSKEELAALEKSAKGLIAVRWQDESTATETIASGK
jgi:hypothetical protein